MLIIPTSQDDRLPLDDWTKRLTRTSSDEMAIQRGDRFDPEAASFTIWWIERYCRLYEGVKAGEPLILMSQAHQKQWEIPDYFDWDDPYISNLYLERLDWHLSLRENGEQMHWQYDFHIRLYGWQTYSWHFNSWVRRHREGLVFIPKKNCKSPTLAANAVYLTVGDGEPGAKAFIMAKTGKQARKIAGQHIQEMFKRSLELQADCKFNKNDMRLSHEPSSGICEPLSSDNKKAREANEGINGNVLIDELHVVDRQAVDIVDRAGISRAEPIHLEVSTAGKDNDTYGRERFDYGLRVQNSQHEDMGICTAIYAADQSLKPVDITEENVLEIARKANPAWGHTINPDELMADYLKSRRTSHKLAEFMVYRLNIWTQSGDLYINPRDWERCADQTIRFETMQGRSCHCAFDMADSNDLCAFCWNFNIDGVPHLVFNFWLPKDQAVRQQDTIEYFAWEAAGEIRLTPGRLIDQEDIFHDIMGTIERYDLDVKSIAYDPNRSRVLAKLLEEAGFRLELFRQNNREYHAWVELFQSLVVGKELPDGTVQPMLAHDGSRIMQWQVGHVQVDEDGNGYKRLVKPSGEVPKKIDGVVSGVMSLRAAELEEPEKESAYDNPNPDWLNQLKQAWS